MIKTYVIADLHGMADHLLMAINIIGHRTQDGSTDHIVIFLGDYIDRGPHSAQVIRTIRNGMEDGKPWIALKGNHEDFMACAVVDNDQSALGNWMMNGGANAVESYCGNTEQLKNDAAWAKALPAFFEDNHRVYVHAFAPEQYALSDAPENILLWCRYPKGANLGYRGKHVVHGHTPQKNGPELFDNRTNLDCGAVFGGKLVIGVFDNQTAGGPIEVIEVPK